MSRKIGDIAIPKDLPILKGKIIKIGTDFDGKTPLYTLKTGAKYIESELQPEK